MIAVAGAGTAVAASQGVFRDVEGNIGIDGSVLSPAYQGKLFTVEEIEQLELQGKARFSVNNPELACQGISLYFDTEAERQAYLTEAEPRLQAAHAATRAHPDEKDACTYFADSPQYVKNQFNDPSLP